MKFVELFTIFFSALIVNNIILMRFLGICSFFGISGKMDSSIGMSLAVNFVMLISTIVTWFLHHFVLRPLNLQFLNTLSFILVIASLVQLLELFMKKNMKSLYKALGIYLPLITTNCAILAVTFLNIRYEYDLLQSVIYTLGVSGGYTLAILLFSSIRQRLATAPIPKFIDGYPLIFFTAALMSLAFMGFSGLFGIH